MISLSGTADRLGDTVLLSVGYEKFEFLLQLPLAARVTVFGSAVSVSAGVVWVVLAHVGKAGHLAPLVSMLCENDGASG